jgi:hypothetical protein
MKTHLTNCILTFDGAPKGQSQAFRDLQVPLEAGEQACRVLFQAVAATLFPSELKPGFTPNRGASQPKVKLVKVSMCADHEGKPEAFDLNPALGWYGQCSGKLYFD